MIELVLSALVGVIAWMQMAPSVQESSFEFEQRINSYFKTGQSGQELEFVNDETTNISVKIFNVRFKEDRRVSYVFRRALWPWQEVMGVTTFDVRIQGLSSDDIEIVAQEIGDHISILPCSHESHQDHYHIHMESTPDKRSFDQIEQYEWALYYIANLPSSIDSSDFDVADKLTGR